MVEIEGTIWNKRHRKYEPKHVLLEGEGDDPSDLSGDEQVVVSMQNNSTIIRYTFEGHMPVTWGLEDKPILVRSCHGQGNLLIKKNYLSD